MDAIGPCNPKDCIYQVDVEGPTMNENSDTPMTPMESFLENLRDALRNAANMQDSVRSRLMPVMVPRESVPSDNVASKNPRELTAPVVNDIIVMAEQLNDITNGYGTILGQLHI